MQQMDMMIEMGTITGDDLEINDLFAGDDTDVLEP
jgi:hypothetical protein